MHQPSNMQHNFARVPQANIPRSQFRTKWAYKTDFDAGYLIPFFVDEVLPGDTFNDTFSMFARLATPIKPVMDNMYLDTFYFYVPNRLLWNNWERFNGAKDDPDDSTDFLIPQINIPPEGVGYFSPFDYMGVEPSADGGSISALHLRAMNFVYNSFFRDENLQNSVPFHRGDGPDPITDYKLLRRGKRHDYFTSSLPFPQKGVAASLSFTGNAPVLGIGKVNGNFTLTNQPVIQSDGSTPTYARASRIDHAGVDDRYFIKGTAATGGLPDIYADLASVSAFTINEFRQAFQIQMLLEMDARGGTRYTEILRAHFGVISPDFRLQRPEYLGGGSTPVQIQQVPQTMSTDGTTPQGNLAAWGSAQMRGDGYTKSFVEHGVIVGFFMVRADLTYQSGLRRMWSRRTRYDFYWPAFAHLGEQAVLNKEIYFTGDPLYDELVFGYQERFAEMRYNPSLITGSLRSSHPQSLDIWHLSQDLVNPVLNAEFIEEDPPIDRVIAVTDEPQFIIDVFGELIRARPMPVYSTPGLITRL